MALHKATLAAANLCGDIDWKSMTVENFACSPFNAATERILNISGHLLVNQLSAMGLMLRVKEVIFLVVVAGVFVGLEGFEFVVVV